MSALAAQIDTLASEVLSGVWLDAGLDQRLASLLNLASAARECGRADIASMAEETVASLSASETAQHAGELIESVLSRMQSALADASPEATADNASLSQDAELVNDFVLESREHLESIEAQLLVISQNAGAGDAIHTLFRSFHTIKGLAGFLEFPLIQEVAHEVETVLDRCRQGELQIDEPTVDIILEARDYIAQWLDLLEQGPLTTGSSRPARPESLLARVALLAEGGAAVIAPPQTSDTTAPQPSAPAEQVHSGGRSARAVKVDTQKLDYLVDMVGELVIAQSLVRHDPEMSKVRNESITRNLSQLARITDEVQRTAMAMRMVPIGPLFQKMARLVRDLSRKSNKAVVFDCEGEHVELDRNIVEELADPLMHMVRNSIDHGIERAEQRVASGKPAPGRVHLRAVHRSGQIVIEVSDDGGGIRRDRVLAKARSQGLISATSSLSDTEILNLIFHPGFSTAERVSEVSGRGVGMDVVRKHIQRLRGDIDIRSVEGQGTTFSLRLPLTLAIIDGLVIAIGQERFIVPLASVREMLRPSPGMVSTVENRAEVVAIRDRLLPVVRLYERLGTTPRSTDPTEAVLVVAEADGSPFALMVDELVGKQEVVIKSLGPVFDGSPGVAGGAILGDGHIGLILDLKGIFGGRADA